MAIIFGWLQGLGWYQTWCTIQEQVFVASTCITTKGDYLNIVILGFRSTTFYRNIWYWKLWRSGKSVDEGRLVNRNINLLYYLRKYINMMTKCTPILCILFIYFDITCVHFYIVHKMMNISAEQIIYKIVIINNWQSS